MGLSRAGEYSALWLGLAVAGALLGGRRGRRAAKEGVLAIGMTSATVNAVKLVINRRRPAPRRVLYRRPRTSSFPSGHAASAFAFAVAVSREVPEAAPVLLPLATSVAYSRVYLGVHYPSDVLVGAALGTCGGLAARPLAQRLGLIEDEARRAAPPSRAEAVLVISPHAGNSRGLRRARRALDRHGIHVAQELDIEQVDRLPELLRSPEGDARLVIAAGGDGTIGSVSGRLVGADNPLGVLPLGTGNDFARALDIPLNPRRAADLIATGGISSVDVGRLTRADDPPAYFVHAASIGVNVSFAKFATQASVRARLGRLTYLAAAAYAMRERSAFTCTLHHDGSADELSLVQLAVISAPVIGGSLGLNIRGPYRDDHRLDVLAIEDVPARKLLLAGLLLLLGSKRPVPGVRALHLDGLAVDVDHPLALALDGEPGGTVPGEFQALAGAIRVISPGSGEVAEPESPEMRDDGSPG
ncbi:MAG: phosphatase PAP2 family protein [Solirubrobacterales bacterium]|nr:phosphatase PAP2 family protein [Solirubrobacterales bacterium]